jgi:hypothetical protein
MTTTTMGMMNKTGIRRQFVELSIDPRFFMLSSLMKEMPFEASSGGELVA